MTCCRRHIFDSYFYKAKVTNDIALLKRAGIEVPYVSRNITFTEQFFFFNSYRLETPKFSFGSFK